jgi:membrane fusion protein (multidrug efflux system)
VVPRSDFDAARSTFAATQARVESIGSSLEKKQIVAPFAGRLGLKLVDIGQDLTKGVPIVSLQKVDPMLVNFSLPQQALATVESGLIVQVATDAVADKNFSGKITAIDTQVDESTRTVRVQATLDSPSEGEDFRLLPGMFAKVDILLPNAREVLMVPLSSVSFNTFGDSVFVLDAPPAPADGVPQRGPPAQAGPGGLSALQQFVQLGERRGDFVEVTRGLKAGQLVAKDGVFKLRNGAPIDITEEGATEPSLYPNPANS